MAALRKGQPPGGSAFFFRFAFAQRFCTARRRISLRSAGGTPFQRALPPFRAPSFDSAAAWRFFFLGIRAYIIHGRACKTELDNRRPSLY